MVRPCPNPCELIHLCITGSGFDYHLLYGELLSQGMAPRVILKGQKIMNMKLPRNNIVCRDSLLYLPNTPLRSFAKMFEVRERERERE